MDKKRDRDRTSIATSPTHTSDAGARPPPSKTPRLHANPSPSEEPRAKQEPTITTTNPTATTNSNSNAIATATTTVTANATATVTPSQTTAAPSEPEISAIDASLPRDPDDDPLIKYQRSQLSATVKDQYRDMHWLRDKVNELQKLVAVLDAAPRAALYHMCAVREDLTLTLARLGAEGDAVDPECPIAATLLDAETVTNDSLAEIPEALKKLTAQIVMVKERQANTNTSQDKTDDKEEEADDEESECTRLKKENHDLHQRLRKVSDQCERYAERDKKSLVSSTTLSDEYDDLREVANIQRKKIVSLQYKLREKQEVIIKLRNSAGIMHEDNGGKDKRSHDSIHSPGFSNTGNNGAGGNNDGTNRKSASHDRHSAGDGNRRGLTSSPRNPTNEDRGGASGAADDGPGGNTHQGRHGSSSHVTNNNANNSNNTTNQNTHADKNNGNSTMNNNSGNNNNNQNHTGNHHSSGANANQHEHDNDSKADMAFSSSIEYHQKEIKRLREMNEKRLNELSDSHAQSKKLVRELEQVKQEISRRDCNVVPMKTILNTALYQTMEATLQQLFLQERNSQKERDNRLQEYENERKDAAEKLEQVNNEAKHKIDDLHKQLDEVRRIADAAKVEKDKVMMTYESRKLDNSSVHVLVQAAEKKAKVSEQMRSNMEKENKNVMKEIEQLKTYINTIENGIKDSTTSEHQLVIERLQKAVEEEKGKANDFIQEVESLSTMFGEVESENKRLVKQLTEKESMLSKVMAERLRGRQLLTTIREENRALTQGRELDGNKVKQLTAAVAASKKIVQETNYSLSKAQEEIRVLNNTLEKRKKIADDCTKNLRSAMAEKDEMKRERDNYMKRVEEVVMEHKQEQFEYKRCRERVEELQLKVDETLKEKGEVIAVNRKLKRRVDELKVEDTNDLIKDGIIDDLRKRLHCSVVTNEEKAVVLLRCGHLFSRKCTDNLIATRNRKCPICGKPFGNDDVRAVYL